MAEANLAKELSTWDDGKNIQKQRSQGCISIDVEVNKKANMCKRGGENGEATAKGINKLRIY